MSDLIKVKTQIDIEDLAADFAAAGDDEQSKFFNIFLKHSGLTVSHSIATRCN